MLSELVVQLKPKYSGQNNNWVDIIGADALVTQRARSSAAMLLRVLDYMNTETPWYGHCGWSDTWDEWGIKRFQTRLRRSHKVHERVENDFLENCVHFLNEFLADHTVLAQLFQGIIQQPIQLFH